MRIISIILLLIAVWAATASGKPSATQLNANDTANGIATNKPFTKSVVGPTSANFRATCWDINTTQDGTFIDAWCHDGRNGLKRSYLSLGMCVVNNNGELDPKPAGRFMESCTPCNLKSKSTILRCQCPTINNGTQDAEIEL
ncbi:hypothetical protein C8035_v006791 [Colletotrichum spinosum]|uniref:Cyanovirin-N domain-containing protein n=1 Tax=Colletotrichum spinosum TaxID=1347390 RepID=A0A4R8QH46_9PEZI|nr:hypothetical protein C8035_v006791 [Colletotrichum spinosum]